MAHKYPTDKLILEESFFSYPLTSISCNLKLTEKILFLELNSKGKTESEELHLSDIIGCHAFRGKNSKSKNETKDQSAYIYIYAYPLKTSGGILSRQLRREKRTLSFQMRRCENEEENFNLVKRWQVAISCLLMGSSCLHDGDVCIPEEIPKPKQLLVLINPKSGSGKAYQIFKERVIPLLVESDTHYELLVTDRANCARDYMKKADVTQWDGIVVVSGDGLLFEVYNGLMARSDWKEVVKIPVGVIPGGSGNGLARAINHAIGEPHDVTNVTSSVLNIIKGKVVPMDMVKVQTPNQFFYSFLSIGWGLMADIDIESERLRALGEARFVIWGVIRAIGLRRYKGKLSYLPVSSYTTDSTPKTNIEPKPKRSKTIDCHLAFSENGTLNDKNNPNLFRSKSFGTHTSDLTDESDSSVQLLKYSMSSEQFIDPYLTSNESVGDDAATIPHLHCEEYVREDSEEGQCTDHVKYCPPLTDPVPDDWTTIEDEFVMAYVCHQTHLSSDVILAPAAKMDDGVMWLVMIRGDVSRAQVMYFLTCLQTGDHVHVPYVDVIPIHAFRLEPFSSEDYLTIDGEVIPCCPIQAEVLPSVARVMSR